MATHLPETRAPADMPIAAASVEAPAAGPDTRVDQAARAIAPLVRALGARRNFAIRFWDGRGLRVTDGKPAFTVVIRRPAALRRMLLPPTDLAIGEAYVHGDFDIEGDIFAAASLPDRFADVQLAPLDWARMASRLAGLRDRSAPREGREPVSLMGERHSATRDRDAVRFHYDLGNDFYRLWLDERMVYSCAYFRKRRATLDEAQLAKLDLVLDKLQVRDGMRLLDIGCGWGGLLIRAVERFDIEAVGITLSEQQYELARERIAERGLAERCRVELLDYRDAAATLGTFDRISSVGMAEHVGRSRIQEYFVAAASALRPGGLFLNHAIAAQPVRMPPPGMVFGGPLRQLVRERSFLDAYVFPDGELLPLSVSLEAAEAAGFTVLDVESLRPHYALTLRHWVARLEAQWDQAVAAAGETTARTWRLFMAGAAVGFESSRLDIHQALLALPRADGSNDAPPIRTWR